MKSLHPNINLKSFILVFSWFLCSNNFILAQTSYVSSENELINKVQRTGLKTSLNFSSKQVGDAWQNYLKKYGKVSSRRNIYKIDAAKIPDISDRPIGIISKVDQQTDNSAYVFCSFDIGSEYISVGDNRYQAAERFMNDFSLSMYRDEYSKEIADAENTFDDAQKNLEDLIKKEQDWDKNIQSSQKDIENMQNKIQDERNNITKLHQSIQDNQTTKREAAEKVERLRSVVADMKVKLQQIN